MSVFDSSVKMISGMSADDAEVSGNPVLIGGVFQSTPDLVDTGDGGRLRMTERRGLITASDYLRAFALSTDVTGIGDITVSTTSIYAGFAAPTAAFFDGSDGGFGSAPRWIKIPMGMSGWQAATITVAQALLTTPTTYLILTCTLKAMLRDGLSNGFAPVTIYSSDIGYFQAIHLSPYLGGTGAASALKQVPAILTPCDSLILELTPSGDPNSGFIALFVNRA